MSSNNISTLVSEIDDLFDQFDKITGKSEEIELKEEVDEPNFIESYDDNVVGSGKIGNLKSLELRVRLGLFDLSEVGIVKTLKRKK